MEAVLVTVLGVVLTAVGTAVFSSHALRRRWAIRRAVRTTERCTPSLAAAVEQTRDYLRPSSTSGAALLRILTDAMGDGRDDELAARFLMQLHRRFEERDMQCTWEPPTATQSTISSVAPLESATMVGRGEELSRVLSLVAERTNVVISGPPGIGKTMLLGALQSRHPSAVRTRLEQGGKPLRDLRLALHRYCVTEFPVDDDQGISEIVRAIPNDALLLVDNADEPSSAEAVMRLVSHLPALTVVVTSRGASFPGFKPVRLEPLSDNEALELLEDLELEDDQRLEAVKAGEGNPLLVLQAGWAASEGSVGDIDDRLHRVVDRLSDEEHRAIWIIGDVPSAMLPPPLLLRAGRLSERGLMLLRRNAVLQPRSGGYLVHQTLRALAQERVAMIPRNQLVELRADCAQALLEWLGEEPAFALVDEVRPAIFHALDTVEDPELKVLLALRIIGDRLDDPRGYLPARGLTSLLLERLPGLTSAAEAVGGAAAAAVEKNLGLFGYWANHPDARGLLLRARERYSELGDAKGRAATTWILGFIADDTSHYKRAESLYRDPLNWLNDQATRAISHHLVGCSLYHQGRYDEARVQFEQAYQDSDDEAVRARIRRRRAYLELAAGDTAAALDQLEEARGEARALNRPRDLARIARHCGEGLLRLDQLARAEEELEVAAAAFRTLGDHRGLGATLRSIAALRRRQGRLDEAEVAAQESRSLARGEPETPLTPMVSPFGAALAEEELARIAQERGDDATYTVRLRTACNILETIGHQRFQSLAVELGALREAPIPRPRGILFDLVDTLAVTRASEYESAKRSISKQLGVDHERFTAAWAASRRRASTDPDWTPADRIQWVASELGLTIGAADLAKLAQGEVQLWSSSVSLRPGVTDALDEIRSLGIRLVLVSNGSSAMRGLPELLGLGPYLDGSLLSADARVLKPDPAIYRQALEIINLLPGECLYVGDGNDRELEGAKAAGIFAVRVMPGEIPAYDSSESLDWDATVSCVEELVTLIRRDA